MEGWIPRNHQQLHAVIELSQLNPSVETFFPPQAAAGDTSTNGAANPTTCGVTVEARKGTTPWKGCPADGTRYIRGRKRDNYQDKRLSCWFWVVLPTDLLLLHAERRPLRVAVFGVKWIITDSKTVTLCL